MNYSLLRGFPDGSVGKNHVPIWEMQVQSLGHDNSLEQEMANPLQYSQLGNPMDSGSWQAVVHGVTNVSDIT